MSDHHSLGFHLHAPVLRAEADAHGLDHELCQLIVEAAHEGEESLRRLSSLLAALFAQEPEVFLLVIGSFESVEAMNRRLGTAPVATIGGMNLYQLGGVASVAGAILEIEAEELALFACAGSRLRDYIVRIEGQEARWWQPSSATLRGALTKAPDLVDPVAFYASSHRSVELLGTRAGINDLPSSPGSLYSSQEAQSARPGPGGRAFLSRLDVAS